MAEIKIYTSYERFHDRIMNGQEKDYILTTKFPSGISVCLGETSLPRNSFLDRFFYREQRAVVCVGVCDNGKHILAINKNKLAELGGNLE